MNTKQAIKAQVNEFLGIKHPWDRVEIPPRYDLAKEGVYRNEMRVPKEGGEPVEVQIFICAPIWVRSYSVDSAGRWYANVEFIDRMDIVRALTIAVSRLYGQAKAVASELVGQGHYVGYDMAAALAKYLLAFRSSPDDVDRRLSEDEQIIEKIKEFILRNEDRFQSGESFPVRNRAGYRYRDTDWWAFTSSALLEASGGHSVIRVARILKEAGLLVVNDASNMMKCPTSGGARPRMYVIAGCILESEGVTLSAHVPHPPPMGESQTWAAETRTTSALAHVAQVAQVGVESSQHGQENQTNPIVTTIKSSDIINENYHPTPAELDFMTTIGGKNNEPDDGRDDQEDDLTAALAAYIAEESYLEDCPERHA